ncbi:MAG: bifunctional metallophosphatase/5'-nucleotidase [Erysipelotrichaceae bacterium]|nr:bifunctional metallophosphatase/5'-nucleotidase [Erysipelotrichaceae bacterium]
MKSILKLLFSAFSLSLVAPFLFGCSNNGYENIVVVYTTDVHCGIEDNIGYASLASYVKQEKKVNKSFTLIDAGDAIQGALVGSLSNGKYIIEIMNDLGYDIYTLGNHEFDYGMDAIKEVVDEFSGDVISCNVSYTGKKENKLKEVKPYSIVDYGFAKVGYVGVTTPSTIVTSAPSTFKEDGEIVYSFSADNLFEKVQQNIDECKNKGCKYVVLVSHLGSTDNYKPYTSVELINNTSGAIAVLDGHSHQVIDCSYYPNKDGINIPLCTAGYKMNAFGRMTIAPNGDVHLGLISKYDDKDVSTLQTIETIEKKIEEDTKKVVATSDLALSIYDESGIRIVRSRETGLGDLSTDAFREVGDTDIAIINGGGIRDNLKDGDLTFGDIKTVFPFGNNLCTIKANGQTILDYLEFTSRKTEKEYSKDGRAFGENGAFAQVSGLKYTIDTSIPSSVVTTDDGIFIKIDGPRRVKDVLILDGDQYVPIDINKFYTITSLNFVLIQGGDGANMFMKCEVLNPNIMLDNEALTYYIVNVLKGHLKDIYSTTGDRITVL